MPQIIPIKELKNTAEISERCHATDEPVFITKNGYGDMVIMSIETWEKHSFMEEVYRKVGEAERQITSGKTRAAHEVAAEMKAKYGL